jgi:hypothetical protein
VQLAPPAVEHAGRWLPALLGPASPAAPDHTRISVGELHLAWAGEEQRLTNVAARLRRGAAGREALVRFWIAGIDMEQPAQLKASWDAGSAAGAPLLELACPEGLPCTLLPPALPLAAWLGPASSFRGHAWWCGGTSQAIQLRGEFAGVDLDYLVGRHFDQPLHGLASVSLRRCSLRHGRLETAAGTLSAGPGFVGRQFLAGAIESLELGWEQPLPADDMLAYDELALEFEVDHDGVRLAGRCRDAPAGSLLADRGQLLAGEPRRQPQPLASLVQMLAPPSAPPVPATREANWLLSVLPLDAAQQPPGEPQKPPDRHRFSRQPAARR